MSTGWRWRCGGPGVCLVVLGLACSNRAALAQQDQQEPAVGQPSSAVADQPLNVLEGIVRAKTDGTPLAKVTVALAQTKDGYIYISSDGTLNIGGGTDDPAGPRRNHKVALKTRTDENGRFRLKSFVSMTDTYTLVAGSKRGVALVRNVVPDKYRDQPLVVELEEPATAKVVIPKYLIPSGGQSNISLQLEPEVTGKNADGSPQYADSQGHVAYFSDGGYGSRRAEFGRLIPNVPYRVTATFSKTGIPYAPTVLEQLFTPKPGETVSLFPDPAKDETLPQGTALAGRITDVDGKPMKYVNVRVCRGAQREQVWGALTNAEGRYELAHLPAGQFRLELDHRRERTAPG